jgi:hypothetical protein
MVRSTVPIGGDSKVLAEWFERRVGGRKAAVQVVRKLFAFYVGEMKKEARHAAAATTKTRSRRDTAAARELRR